MKVNIEKIQKELERRNWGKARLAQESKLSRQTIYDIFKSKTCFFSSISNIARALDYDAKDLLK